MSQKFEDNSDKAKEQMRRNVAKCLTMLGMHAQRRITEITPVDTGLLKGSITYHEDIGNDEVKVGTPVFYGIYVENGTRFMAAQPFITPGIMNYVEEYRTICRQTLAEGFE